MVCLYYENYDNSAHYLASLLHLFIIRSIKQESIEFAFLISNYVMMKKNKGILIPYEYVHLYYQRTIDTNQLSDLIRVFFDIEYVKDESLLCQYSGDEMIQMMKSIKDDLKERLECDIDILDFTFALDTLGENEMEYVITLI